MVSGLISHVKVIEDDGNIVEVKMWQVTPKEYVEPYQFKDLKKLTEDFYNDIRKYKERGL